MPESTIRYSCGCEDNNGQLFPCDAHQWITGFMDSHDVGEPRVLTARYPDDPLPTDPGLPY